MRQTSTAMLAIFLLAALTAPSVSAAPIERVELAGNISLITSSPNPGYFILALINKNDYNVSPVNDVSINFPYDIDPRSIKAVDNYNQTLTPTEIGPRHLVFTYNNTLPPLGYGKIFLDVEELKTQDTTIPPVSTEPPPSTAPPTDAPILTPAARQVTSHQPIVQSDAPVDSEVPIPGEGLNEHKDLDLDWTVIGLAALLLLALTIALLRL